MANFRNLVVWQKADDLALHVYRLTESFPKREVFGLTAQLRRAAVSIATNIVEGNNRKSKRELYHFIDIALGSLAEIEYLLMLSKRLEYIKGDTDYIDKLVSDVGKLLWNFQKSL